MKKHQLLSLLAATAIAQMATPLVPKAFALDEDQAANMKKPFAEAIKDFNGQVDLVWVGDSNVFMWKKTGLSAWQMHFGDLKYLNLASDGDFAWKALNRFKSGLLDGYEAKLFIIMLGANDIVEPEEVSEKISELILLIQEKQPKAKVILNAILPRGQTKEDALRQRIDAINNCLSNLGIADVAYVDFSPEFLDSEGQLNPELFREDNFKLKEKGFEVWAEALSPKVQEILKQK